MRDYQTQPAIPTAALASLREANAEWGACPELVQEDLLSARTDTKHQPKHTCMT